MDLTTALAQPTVRWEQDLRERVLALAGDLERSHERAVARLDTWLQETVAALRLDSLSA